MFVNFVINIFNMHSEMYNLQKLDRGWTLLMNRMQVANKLADEQIILWSL